MIELDKKKLTKEQLDSPEFAFIELMNACDAYKQIKPKEMIK